MGIIAGRIRQILICICITVPFNVSHAESYSADQTKPSEKKSEQIVYVPPPTKQLKPEIRIAKGGVRGDADCSRLPTITLLVPNHVAFTLKPQPVFFFHSTASIAEPVILTFIDPDMDKPLIELALKDKVKMGLNEINLADYGVSLDTNKEYEWSIQINHETSEKMTCYSVARAYVKKGISDADVAGVTSVSEADNSVTEAKKLAGQGIWYDALAALIEQKKTTMKEPGSREMLNTFLEQGELGAVF